MTIRKTVTVDAGKPDSVKVDVFFLADTTGSMGGRIAAAKANAATIIDGLSSLGDVWFGAGNCGDTPDAVFTYRQDAALTGVKADVPSGANAWSALGAAISRKPT